MKLQPSAKSLTLFSIMIAIGLALFVAMPTEFFTPINFQSMASQIPEFGLLALAMMLAMITGGIDLSIVAVSNLTGVVAAMVLTSEKVLSAMPEQGAIVLAVIMVVAMAALCGLFNGILIAVFGVPAILATLGSQGLFLGLSIILTKGHSISGLPESFAYVGNGEFLHVPVSFIMFAAVAVLVSALLNKTRQGFNMYMVGTNSTVAKYSGIDNRAVIIRTYMITGILAGLASLVMISRANSMRPGYGDAYLLQAILVVVLGGTDPNGGFGKVSSLLMGIIILQITQSGLNIMSLSPFLKKFMWGFALLLVMVLNYAVAKYHEKKRIKMLVRKPSAC